MAAGYDLYSAEETTVPAHGKALIDTQIAIALPEGTYGRIAPRSGIASEFMINTGAGVIDADYRGSIKILLFNLSNNDFKVNEGDRIAQLIIEKIATIPITETQTLAITERGSAGFGSTGITSPGNTPRMELRQDQFMDVALGKQPKVICT